MATELKDLQDQLLHQREGASLPAPRSGTIFSNIQSFEDAQRMAMPLCMSPLVPKEFQGKDNIGSVLIILELAQRIDMSPFMLMQNVDVIHGRPAMRAKLKIACLNRTGDWTPIDYEERGEVGKPQWGIRAYATAKADGKTRYGQWITMELANAEGWTQKTGSKWKTIPERMARWRAGSWFVDQYAPEITLGMPSTEELVDIDAIDVDPSGRITNLDELRARADGKSNKSQTDRDEAVEAEVVESRPHRSENDSSPDQEQKQPERADGLTPEDFPIKDDDGNWVDYNGEVWCEEKHAWSKAAGAPSINKDGSFRARRGTAQDDDDDGGEDEQEAQQGGDGNLPPHMRNDPPMPDIE